MIETSQLNQLQIEAALGPILRNINECTRYVKEDLEQGNIAGVQLWNSRLIKAQQTLADKSDEILAQQQIDQKVAVEDSEMERQRNRSGVTS